MRIPVIHKTWIAAPVVAVLVVLAAAFMLDSPANAAPWTRPGYLYRYFVWGAQRVVSPRSDDYLRYGFHTIDKSPAAFHFAPGERDRIPATVEYSDGNVVKRVALDELLRTTSTHAFIVIRDNQVLSEDYFNGFARDSLCTAWSLSKSVTSALVGIAIADGYIKSLDDPIVNYLPELKDQGFDAITIRNLLTMRSGIQYRISFFPWDEFVLAGYYPDIRQLLLADLKIMEPPGQSFHYNNFNAELIGMILERTTHRRPANIFRKKSGNLSAWNILPPGASTATPTASSSRPYCSTPERSTWPSSGACTSRAATGRASRSSRSQWVADSTTPDPSDHRPWETFSRWQDKGGYYKYFLVGYFASRTATTASWASALTASSSSSRPGRKS